MFFNLSSLTSSSTLYGYNFFLFIQTATKLVMTSPGILAIDQIDSDVADVVTGSVLATEQNDVTRRLFDCVKCRNVDGVARVFSSPEGADVDHESRDDQGHTCIRMAVEDGSADIVRILLQVQGRAPAQLEIVLSSMTRRNVL